MGEATEPEAGTGGRSACCSPQRAEPGASLQRAEPGGPPAPAPRRFAQGKGTASHDDIFIPGGTFAMGDAFGEGYPSDGETPVHEVSLDGFRIDATPVTNEQFAAFAEATGYRTEAEQYGTSAVFHLLARARTADVLGVAAGTPWWLNVRGADWAHPHGPLSHWSDVPDHPVVHVSWNDALAYCVWAGRRLPTEAEREYAARGGLAGRRYAWGDELTPGGRHLCNIWQGTFPTVSTRDDGILGTAPVRSFPANGYGLYEVAGNVWEWCGDWFLPGYYRSSPGENPQGPASGAGRVMRGGSYLCHESYCNRYRVAARTANTPDSSTGHCGFRTVGLC